MRTLKIIYVIGHTFFWVVIHAAVVLTATSCTSTFYHADGTPSARIMGDYTYSRSAKGDESFTLKHSPVIRAGGVATSQGIAATGTAASAVILSRP